jgi:hypothetical protein
MKPGDSVKLTDRYAAVLNKHPHCAIDWAIRRGVCQRSNQHDVFVLWEGRATLDQIPLKAVELA